MRDLTGLRVTFDTGDGTAYGVARVRYHEGHAHAGRYEIERADGTSFLASLDTCRPGPNWEDTPEEGRFTGAEFFTPAFLDGTRRRFLSASPGVAVPGDMGALRELVEQVEPGWEVDWYSHGANEFRGRVTVESVDARGMRVKAPEGAPSGFTWPTAGVEFGPQYAWEFQVDGSALHIVSVPAKRTGKSPSRSLSLTFREPRRW